MSSDDPKHHEDEEVAITTGEEDEDHVLDLDTFVCHLFLFWFLVLICFWDEIRAYLVDCKNSKFYRLDKDGNQWKERGVGTVKFLKHKVTGKVRLVMRPSKTLQIYPDHFIVLSMTVQEHVGNKKSCVC
ncbi:hypothetical protein QN277_020483 [Acacia crassicarpa]|uniref:RanBD1 domain-containing protein n=1 Tax=Acacia crassicarpa TaxID=499986 RepID=A0AAE1MS58_9FABA|nr:hypothetical protein QN277_020483 [Acacia crassicarpa]